MHLTNQMYLKVDQKSTRDKLIIPISPTVQGILSVTAARSDSRIKNSKIKLITGYEYKKNNGRKY